MAQPENKESKKPEKVTAADIVNALIDRFSDERQYVRGFEVGLTTGGASRRIDCVVMDCYQSHGFKVEGIEIKVSRADLRRELENNDKHAEFYENLDYFSLAAPREIIDKDIIPPTWGIYGYFDGSLNLIRKPLMLHDVPPKTLSKGFAASFIRSVKNRGNSESEIQKAVREAKKKAFDKGREYAERELGGPYLHEKLEKLDRYEKMFGFTLRGDLDALEALAAVVGKSGLLYLYGELQRLDKEIRKVMKVLVSEAPSK